MRKDSIVAEISKRLGDPEQLAFADRIWGYFTEALYEALAGMSKAEMFNLTKRVNGTVVTDISGNARVYHDTQLTWNAVMGVNVSGMPAREIDAKEYQMMKSNSMYAPAAGEAYYYLGEDALILLTAYGNSLIGYEVLYLLDMHAQISELGDEDDLAMPNSILYKAIPATVNKIKQEIGITL